MDRIKKPIFWANILNYVYFLFFAWIGIVSTPSSPLLFKLFMATCGAVILIVLIAYVLALPRRIKLGMDMTSGLIVSSVYIVGGVLNLFIIIQGIDIIRAVDFPMRLFPFAGAGALPFGMVMFTLFLLEFLSSRKSTTSVNLPSR